MNFLKKLEQIALVAWLFFLPWQTRLILVSGNLKNEYWEMGTVSLYALDILLALIIIVHIINRHSFGIREFFKKQTLFLIVLLGLIAANLWHSANLQLSVFHLSWLLFALAACLIIRQNIISKKVALLSFIAGASVACLLGTWQFINQITPQSKWFGLAIHQSFELGTSVIETVAPDGQAERWLRAYGPFDHPNILGGVAAISLLLLIYFIWTYRGQLKQAERIFVMIATICLTAGLLVSFSRAAWLAFIIGALAYFIFLGEDRKQFIKKTLSTKIIMLAIIIIFAIPYHYVFMPRFNGTSRLETISTSERLSGVKESLILIAQNPIIGSGIGTYGLALEKVKPGNSVWYYQPVHNTFLLITSELGLAGLALFIWLSVLGFKILAADRERRLVAIALISSFVILMFFDHWLLSLHFGPILAAATLGLLMKKA